MDIWGKVSNNVDRYRNWFDPVSVFDRSAVKSVKWNPFESSSLTHDCSNIAEKMTSSEQVPVSSENPDGSVSLIVLNHNVIYIICSATCACLCTGGLISTQYARSFIHNWSISNKALILAVGVSNVPCTNILHCTVTNSSVAAYS